MSAANKAALDYTMHGASLLAFAAAGTLRIIYSRKIIHNLDRALGAGALALAASDTAGFANTSYFSALVVIAAKHRHTRGISYDVDYRIRTGANAKSAAYALLRVYLCNVSFVYRNSVAGANSHAIAIAEAGKCAESVA